MKLSKDVLLEIVSLIQDGIMNGKDISENLRQLDLSSSGEELTLSADYLEKNPRAATWVQDTAEG